MTLICGGMLGIRALYGEWLEEWWKMLLLGGMIGVINLVGFIEGFLRGIE